MHKVSIQPQWTITDPNGVSLSPRLLSLLLDVADHGSLLRACKATGCSYRHAWNLIRQGQEQLGTPLLNMEKGKGSSLTPIAEKLVWAGHRINARLSPMLETLSSELAAELSKVITLETRPLVVHASHGFAVEKLIETLVAQNVPTERKYVGSQEAVASQAKGHCLMAGFHIPMGAFEKVTLSHYAKWLNPKTHALIHVTRRRQGLMVAQGNPKNIHTVSDLVRPGVRYVNRQPSSGTRFLLDCLLKDAKVKAQDIEGYNVSEYTHAAVAAYVASGMADAGLAVETPAKRFKLDFVPLVTERYFLLVNQSDLDTPAIRAVLDILSSEAFKASVNELSGYDASECASIQTLREAFGRSSATSPPT
jgi:molybdate transport repressor ModE-like protein